MEIAKTVWSAINLNFISQLLGGFLATATFWIIFEHRIKNLIESREKTRISKMFLEQILYNRIVAAGIVKKQEEYTNSSEFTFLKYETENLDKFLGSEPLELETTFYANARIISSVFKKDNMFIDIYWFAPGATETDRKNYKQVLIDNAKTNITSIDKILNDKAFVEQMKQLGLTNPNLYKP